MGYGSEAAGAAAQGASAAGEAGSIASAAGEMGSMASTAGEAGSMAGAGGGAFNAMQAADTAQFASNASTGADTMAGISNASGGTAASAPVGGSLNSIGVESTPNFGPTNAASNNMANGMSAEDSGVGMGLTDRLIQTIRKGASDYARGGEQNLGEAWDNAGFNMKTAGYLGKKMPSGGAPSMPAMSIPQGQSGTQGDPMQQFRRRQQMYRGY